MGLIDIVIPWLVVMACIYLGVKVYETVLLIYIRHKKIAANNAAARRRADSRGTGDIRKSPGQRVPKQIQRIDRAKQARGPTVQQREPLLDSEGEPADLGDK